MILIEEKQKEMGGSGSSTHPTRMNNLMNDGQTVIDFLLVFEESGVNFETVRDSSEGEIVEERSETRKTFVEGLLEKGLKMEASADGYGVCFFEGPRSMGSCDDLC